MKKDIHPKVYDTVIKCACGATFETKSTEKEIHVEICSSCHPFFTGKQKFLDTAGGSSDLGKSMAKRLFRRSNLISSERPSICHRAMGQGIHGLFLPLRLPSYRADTQH